MVIQKEYFMLKIKELKTLMNASGSWENFAQEAFKRVYGRTYSVEDLDGALEEILESDIKHMSFPVLLKALNTARSIRFDKESQDRQHNEKSDHQMFWDRQRALVGEPCTDRRCGSCPPDKSKYCEDVALRTLQFIKERYSMDDCKWSINDRLMKEFPGYGFEKIYGRHKLAKIVDGALVSCDANGRTGNEPKRRTQKEFQEELEGWQHGD